MTFDPTLQRQMERLSWVLPGSDDFETAIASVDPTSELCGAFIGPGSLISSSISSPKEVDNRIFVQDVCLAAAIENGLYPFDTISGVGPCTFPNPPNVDYEVSNFNDNEGVSAQFNMRC